ncbi:MAG: glycine cleavage system protein GcvH [Rhodospirillaceae bacterium]
MAEVKYTDQHEWLLINGDVAKVGITDYAQEQLGDVVFVELPQPGTEFNQGDEAAVVESVKAAAEVYAPVTGEIVEANSGLEDDPAVINSDAQGEGWFFTIKMSDAGELETLMDEAGYKDFIADLD